MLYQTAPTIMGPHNNTTNMYLVNLKKLTSMLIVPPYAPTSTINHVYNTRTKVDLATYLHLCAWLPVVNSWTKAIDRVFYLTWPGITSQLIKKHLPKSMPNDKCHLKMTHQHV